MKTVYRIHFVCYPHLGASVADAFAADAETKARPILTSDIAVVEALLKEKLESGRYIRVRNRFDYFDTIRLNDLGDWHVTEVKRGN